MANANGTAMITVTVTDNGGTLNGECRLHQPGPSPVTVTAVNDRPVVDLNGGGAGNEGIDNTAAFTEDQASATTLAPAALVTDIDNSNLTWPRSSSPTSSMAAPNRWRSAAVWPASPSLAAVLASWP